MFWFAIPPLMVLFVWGGYKYFQGKSYCVAGPIASGKTTLAILMEKGKLETGHKRTDHNTEIGNKCIDMSGSESAVKIGWKNAIEKQEYCLYLFDVKKYHEQFKYADDTYSEIVKKHLNTIKGYSTKIIIIGTHLDLLFNDAAQKVEEDLIGFLRQKNIPHTITIGSLNNEGNAEKLAEEIKKCMKGYNVAV